MVCNVKWNVVHENSHCSALVFYSTDSGRTSLDPAYIILNYFFFIFQPQNSWTSFLALLGFEWCETIWTLMVSNPTALTVWLIHPQRQCQLSLWGQMGHLLWGFVSFVLGTGFFSLSQAFEVIGHEFVLLAYIGRQRLRRLRTHFQVSNGYFSSIYYLSCNQIYIFMYYFEVLWSDWWKPVRFVILIVLDVGFIDSFMYLLGCG